MAIQKAISSKPINPENPYHPDDINYVYSPVERVGIIPNPSFNYTKVYPVSADLPSASASSGDIAYVIGTTEGARQFYSDGTNWLPLIQ